MMVTMRSIMRLSGPPRPPKLPRPGAGPEDLCCPNTGAIEEPLLQQAALALRHWYPCLVILQHRLSTLLHLGAALADLIVQYQDRKRSCERVSTQEVPLLGR